MSSRFVNVSLVSFSSFFLTTFGTFGVGILPWTESISESVDAKSLYSFFLRSCFCRARIFRWCNLFSVVSKSAWLISRLDLFSL